MSTKIPLKVYFTAEHPFFPMPGILRAVWVGIYSVGMFFALTDSVQYIEHEEFCQKLLAMEKTFRESSRSHFPRQCAMIDVTWGE